MSSTKNKYRSPLPVEEFQLNGVVFRPVKGYEGRFAASACGLVLGVMRRVLEGRVHPGGYRMLNVLESPGAYSNLYVHRAVALTWVPNPGCKPYVNHLDGDKTNNRADNLEWVTAAENSRHAVATGLCTNCPTKGQQGFQHG